MAIETETFTCGHCGEPVVTEWVTGDARNGLLNSGSYVLLGDVFFHEPFCADSYLQEFSAAAK